MSRHRWRDTSSFSQGDKVLERNEWTLEIGITRLVVHRSIHEPGWFASAHPYTLRWKLDAADPKAARDEAVLRLSVFVNSIAAELREVSEP